MSGDVGRPLPMIRGERVYLRASERSDISLFVRWLNDAETASYLSMRAPMSVAMEEQWFNRMLERMWLEVYDYNVRARRSYEKCGFVLEGTERHAIFRRGRFIDVHPMSILRAEWASHNHRRSWDYTVDEG